MFFSKDSIDAKEAYEEIGNESVLMLDVRTKEEYASGHIEGSANFDIYQSSFVEELNKLPKNKKCIVYCQSGGRAGQALGIMKKNGFENVSNLKGGIMEWKEKGLPVVH
ncbi:MAG: rhodanese-like domain-containing protein [Patescibacteria group bacterium]|nr:rhodanese-like domain-containing protein [Patescibacteria group bacterium]